MFLIELDKVKKVRMRSLEQSGNGVSSFFRSKKHFYLELNPFHVFDVIIPSYEMIKSCSNFLVSVICRLETYIGNITDKKHQNRLET